MLAAPGTTYLSWRTPAPRTATEWPADRIDTSITEKALRPNVDLIAFTDGSYKDQTAKWGLSLRRAGAPYDQETTEQGVRCPARRYSTRNVQR